MSGATLTKRRRKAGGVCAGSSERRNGGEAGGEELGEEPGGEGEEEEMTAYKQLLVSLGTKKRMKKRRRRMVRGDCQDSEKLLPASDLPSEHGAMVVTSHLIPPSDVQGENGDGGDISDDGDGGDSGDDGDSGDGERGCAVLQDHFREHFDSVLTSEEVATLETAVASTSLPSQPSQLSLPSQPSPIPLLGIVTHRPGLPGREPHVSSLPCSLSQLLVKRKLSSNWTSGQTASPFSDLQRELFHHMNVYKDVLYSLQAVDNIEDIRRVYVLHILNHVLKTRSRVLKNNHKLLQASKGGRSMEEPRDQGLTRPKALILLPFRHSALQVINTLTSLLVPPGQGLVQNQRRFQREFGTEGDGPGTVKVSKPSSYSAMFAGNTDDCFKLGVALRGKGVRLFADFYSADVIVASPLGLRTVIGAEGEKGDSDFLSSVEVLVLDQTDVFLMQNWEHVTHVLSHLHLRPREAHGVDFSRVREWALNEWSRWYQQTLVFSALQTPEINSLLTTYCHNYAGSVRWDRDTSVAEGSVGQVVGQLPQMFTRLSSPPSYSELLETRLQHFTTHVLPGYQGDLMKGTLIFIPSYFDFVRVRNYMKKQELSFAVISEYTTPSKVSRARTQFYQKITPFLLYTERAHFFHRYRLKGVQHVLFYSLPTYPEHYSDMVNMLEGEGGAVQVLYSRWDQLALCRVVGGARAQRMLSSSDDTHMLVTGSQHSK